MDRPENEMKIPSAELLDKFRDEVLRGQQLSTIINKVPTKETEYRAEILKLMNAATSLQPRCPKCRGLVVLRHVHVGHSFCGVQCPKCLPDGTWWINSAEELTQFFVAAPDHPRECPKCSSLVSEPSKSTVTGLWTQRCDKCEWFDSWAGMPAQETLPNALTEENIIAIQELERKGQTQEWTTMELVHVHQALGRLLEEIRLYRGKED